MLSQSNDSPVSILQRNCGIKHFTPCQTSGQAQLWVCPKMICWVTQVGQEDSLLQWWVVLKRQVWTGAIGTRRDGQERNEQTWWVRQSERAGEQHWGTCPPNQQSAIYHAQRLKRVLAHGMIGFLFKSSARAADSPVCRNLWCLVHEGAIFKVTWENGIAWAIQEEVSKEDMWMHPCVIKKKKKRN